MAKKMELHDKGKIRGIRRRWLLNSVGVVLLILALALGTFIASLRSYYYTGTTDDLMSRASSTAYSFRNYTSSEYSTVAQRTVSEYEEKGLLVPQMEHRNGRDYREYTQADVDALREIATLRRAWFTMDEIARMQQNPETIGEIFPQYLQWLEKQKTTLESLLKAAKNVDPSKIQSVSELSEKMREAETMPLPAADTEPKFQYLDALEQRPEKVEPEWKEPLPGGMADSRIYRQFVAANSKDKSDDLGVAFGQLRDAMTPERESTPVA